MLINVFPEAKENLKTMTQRQFKLLQDEVQRKPLAESLQDSVNRGIILNILKKLNILIDQLNCSAFLDSDEQGVLDLTFLEKQLSWAVKDFAF